jgi:hypothetical protein
MSETLSVVLTGLLTWVVIPIMVLLILLNIDDKGENE